VAASLQAQSAAVPEPSPKQVQTKRWNDLGSSAVLNSPELSYALLYKQTFIGKVHSKMPAPARPNSKAFCQWRKQK
jgi:hypothetical protein